MQSLPDYTFQPSASGHSLARIDAMFARLLERETDPRAAASGNYVAAVGDDEQFAVAVALIARELGFPVAGRARRAPRLGGAGLAACDGGRLPRAGSRRVDRGAVRGRATGSPIDVTPQFAQSPSLEVTEQRDPENVTEVRPDAVEEVRPARSASRRTPAPTTAPTTPRALDLAWLWPILRIGRRRAAGPAASRSVRSS